MPLAICTDQTFEVSLAVDREKPVEARPVFVFRYMSDREWKRLATIHDLVKEQDGPEALTSMEGELTPFLVGWRNMDRPFDRAELEDVVGPADLQELIDSVLAANALGVPSKKVSASQSLTDSDESAGGATGQENVSIRQAQTSQ